MARVGAHYPPGTIIERFRARVDQSGECWLWTGGRTGNGYGTFWDGARERVASRVAWELSNGPIPAGARVLHRCDNPPCVRPEHLFLGTQADNIADMMAKGRGKGGTGGSGPRPREFCKRGHRMSETRRRGCCWTCHLLTNRGTR